MHLPRKSLRLGTFILWEGQKPLKRPADWTMLNMGFAQIVTFKHRFPFEPLRGQPIWEGRAEFKSQVVVEGTDASDASDCPQLFGSALYCEKGVDHSTRLPVQTKCQNRFESAILLPVIMHLRSEGLQAWFGYATTCSSLTMMGLLLATAWLL